MTRTFLLLACLTLALAPLAAGAVTGQVDLVSRYVWRGFDLLPDNHPAFQPSLAFDLGNSGFSLGLWSSFALAKWDEYKDANEIDLCLAYDFTMAKGWELAAGFTLYGYWFAEDFRFRDATSPELYITATRTDLPLSPQLAVYYDFNLGSGLYVTLGGSHEWKISDTVSVEAAGLIGFNSRQYIDKTGFSDIDLNLKAPLALGGMILTPSLNVMVPLQDEINDRSEIWIGLSAAFGNGD